MSCRTAFPFTLIPNRTKLMTYMRRSSAAALRDSARRFGLYGKVASFHDSMEARPLQIQDSTVVNRKEKATLKS